MLLGHVEQGMQDRREAAIAFHVTYDVLIEYACQVAFPNSNVNARDPAGSFNPSILLRGLVVKAKFHAAAGAVALLCIVTFWTSTVVSELLLSTTHALCGS